MQGSLRRRSSSMIPAFPRPGERFVTAGGRPLPMVVVPHNLSLLKLRKWTFSTTRTQIIKPCKITLKTIYYVSASRALNVHFTSLE